MKNKYFQFVLVALFSLFLLSDDHALADSKNDFITIYWFEDENQQFLMEITKTTDLWAESVPEPIQTPRKDGYDFVGWYDVDSEMNLETENLTWLWLVEDKSGAGLKNVGLYGSNSLHFIPIWKAVPTPEATTTPINTPTSTPTSIPTDIPASTPTETSTVTPSVVPVITPTPPATATPTATPTTTPTTTPTATPTATNSQSFCTPSCSFVPESIDASTNTMYSTNTPTISSATTTGNCLVPTGNQTFSKKYILLIVSGSLILILIVLSFLNHHNKKNHKTLNPITQEKE